MLKNFFNIPIGLAVAASLPMLSSLILVLYKAEGLAKKRAYEEVSMMGISLHRCGRGNGETE